MKKLLAVVAVFGAFLLAACEPQPPAPTVAITATLPRSPECAWLMDLNGTVPATHKTNEVVMQIKAGGAWSDWLWYETFDSGETGHRIRARVDPRSGAFYVTMRAPLKAGQTYAFRVRSAGGSVVSNTMFVTPKPGESGKCPTTLLPASN